MNEFIRTIIEMNAPMSIEQIAREIINDFESSPDYKMMRDARRYYRNENDIMKKERYSIINGEKQVNKNLANNRISHPFLRDLTDQKVQYLMSNDWSVDDIKFSEFLTEKNCKTIELTVRDSILYGTGWLFVLVSENEIKIERKDPLSIIPVWKDTAHTELDVIINRYVQIEYVAGQKKEIMYCEWWDKDGVKVYKDNGGAFTLLEEHSHFSKGNKEFNWNRLPFVYIKYNDDETSLLQLIKSMVDAYDMTVSETADIMQDSTDKIKVISGAEGTDIKVLANNMKNYRIVSVPEGGDLKEVGSEADVASQISQLEQLRKDIYDFGRGVDTNSSMGANASGEARKYLYAKLDLDCNQLETGVLDALQQLIWFLNNSPVPYGINEDVNIEFSRNMMINTTEIIDNAVKAQGISGVATETIVGLLPFVDDPIKEIEKARAEADAEFERQQSIVNQLDGINDGANDEE